MPLALIVVFAVVVVVSFLGWALARMSALGDREDR